VFYNHQNDQLIKQRPDEFFFHLHATTEQRHPVIWDVLHLSFETSVVQYPVYLFLKSRIYLQVSFLFHLFTIISDIAFISLLPYALQLRLQSSFSLSLYENLLVKTFALIHVYSENPVQTLVTKNIHHNFSQIFSQITA